MKASRRRIRVLTARNALARGLPASLPETDVEEIPLFGTSWYTRRVSYYLLRVLATLLMLIGLAMAVTFDVALFQAADSASFGARLAWRLVLGILFLVSFVSPLRTLRRERERRRAGEFVYSDDTRGGKSVWIAQGNVFLAVASVLFLGRFVSAFLETFRHEYRVEHDARLRLQLREKWQASNQAAAAGG